MAKPEVDFFVFVFFFIKPEDFVGLLPQKMCKTCI